MNQPIVTPFRLLTLDFELTEQGILNYQKILALTFAYLKLVRENWLTEGTMLDLFKETKTMSNLSFDVYTA